MVLSQIDCSSSAPGALLAPATARHIPLLATVNVYTSPSAGVAPLAALDEPTEKTITVAATAATAPTDTTFHPAPRPILGNTLVLLRVVRMMHGATRPVMTT